MPDQRDYEGREVYDAAGAKVGRVSTVYVDQDTQRPEWGLVDMGLFGSKHTFVPLTAVNPEGEMLKLPYDKEVIKGASRIDPEKDGELSMEEESQLAKHYGLGYSTQASKTGVVTGGAPPAGGKATDGAMTRSEEKLKVGVTRRPSELVRLKKTVSTEPVSETVSLQKEELRVEREPITKDNIGQAKSGAEISEAEHEVTLMQEEPVVEKKTVPVERVRLEKDVRTEEQTVSDEVRKEQIDVDREPKRR